MKINRLFEILYILIEKKTVSASYLAKHFEVSTRTVYRDIEALLEAGIPIYTQKGKNGGIRILEDFILDKSLLSDQEQNEILLGLQSLKVTKYPKIDSKINKLASIFNKSDMNWIEVDFSDWQNDENEKQKFNLTKEAVLNKKIISFDYYNSYGNKSNRTIEPLKIFFKSRNWYIYGFCKLKKDFRLFKLKRIENLKISNENFNRTSFENILNKSEVKDNNINKIELILKIDKEMSYRVLDEFNYNNIKKNDDSSYTVSVNYPEDEWVYGYILSFGTYAEVIEPLHIRKIIKKRLEKTLKKYL